MGFNHTLTRMLSEPDAKQREILEGELLEESDPKNSGQISFLNGLAGDLDAKVICINKNTDQKLIVVTQDKTLLTLKKNIARLGRKGWVAPLSTVMTLMTALITSNFRHAVGLGPSEWRAMFIISALLSAGWLAYSIKKAFNSKGFNEVITDIVYDLGDRKRPKIENMA